MFLLWLWYMMSWIAAVVMTRLCWRGLSGRPAWRYFRHGRQLRALCVKPLPEQWGSLHLPVVIHLSQSFHRPGAFRMAPITGRQAAFAVFFSGSLSAS